MSTSACSGQCHAGYHCYAGSTSPTQYECAVFSVTGTILPTAPPPSVPTHSSSSSSSRVIQPVLTATIGVPSSSQSVVIATSVPLSTTTTNNKHNNHHHHHTDYQEYYPTTTLYVPSTNLTYVTVSAPNSVYCPTGTAGASPLLVQDGYYTVGNNKTTRMDQQPCPMGSYCIAGYIDICVVYTATAFAII